MLQIDANGSDMITILLKLHNLFRDKWYCWWKKSCTTWHVWNPANHRTLPMQDFSPSTVWQLPWFRELRSPCCHIFIRGSQQTARPICWWKTRVFFYPIAPVKFVWFLEVFLLENLWLVETLRIVHFHVEFRKIPHLETSMVFRFRWRRFPAKGFL